MGSSSMWTYLLSIIVFFPPLVSSGTCLLEPDGENVVSTQLEGHWVENIELNQILTNGASLVKEFKFYKNESIAHLIPEEECMELSGRHIYMIGQCTTIYDDGRSDLLLPFVLTSVSGNPRLEYYYFYDDASYNDESFNLMMARAADSSNDILFVGGDFNNQEFYAFKRKL